MSSDLFEDRYRLMTEAPVKRLICSLAVPTIVTMLTTAFYNLADTYYVGLLGTSETAAVGVALPLMSLIQALGYFFGQGSGNYISRQLGARHEEAAAQMASVGFFSALIVGIILAVVSQFFLEPIARALGSTDTILPYACDYIRYITIGIPWMMASFVLNVQLRFLGHAFFGMIGITGGALLNIALAPLFIFVFHLGVGGAALAAIVSQLAGGIVLFIACSRQGLKLHPRYFKFQWENYREICRGGFPSLMRQGFQSVGIICLNHMAGAFGDAAIAGISIVSRVAMFPNSVMIGFGQGFQPVCGFNYGAKLYRRVKLGFWFCARTGFVGLLAVSAILFAFAPEVIALFRDDAEVITAGTLALRAQTLVLPLAAWITMCNMLMQVIGKAVKASLLAAARQGLFLLPLLFILTPFLGLTGVQISQAVADAATFLLAIPLGLSVLREMKDVAAD
jgi:putative MATE family efflux protein